MKMYKGVIWCRSCDDVTGDGLSNYEFESILEMPQVCPKCGSDDIFYQQLDFGNDKDDCGVKTGGGGCGGYRR